MPSKENAKKSGATTKQKTLNAGGDDMRREAKLQAILLADSFSKCFRPLTHTTPKVLLPLVNVPMIEYTIEFLAANGVEELFVFCVWHAPAIQEYLSKSKWNKLLTIKCITSNACLSAGEALREIDSMGIVRSDPFILISGDVVSNMDLKKAIQFHKDKRKEDNNAIMTVVLKKVHYQAHVKPIHDDLVVAMDAKTDQLLLFENAMHDNSLNIPQEIIVDHPALKFHADLLDCHIDVCSPELLLQFSDNFDYLDIRRHFIQNEVVNWELGMHIYGYILKNEYAARIHDLKTYHSISNDIIHRWAYPLVPDTHLLHKEATFSHSRRFIYKDVQSTVSRSAVLGDGVVVGQDAVVGDGVDLKGTVVGARCIIRGGSVIADSHLFAGVVIEQDVKITHAIIAENVTVKKGAVISRGCVLSAGVIIGEGIILPEFTRVSLRRSIVTPAADVDDTFGGDIDVGVVGTDGVGLKWVYEGGDDYTLDKICDDDDGTGIDMIRASSMGCFEEECERARRWKVFPLPVDEESDGDESDEDGLDAPQASVDFDDVIGDMVASGLKSNDLAENILMEIKGFKFAQNKEFADCITASVPALLTHMSTMGINKIQLIGNCKTFFSVGGKGFTILNGLCQDEEDEVVLIEAIEEMCIGQIPLRAVFRFILQILYDSALLKEEAFLVWIEARNSQQDLQSPRVELFCQPEVQDFVMWLQEDDDEEDDEDDDDDEEDDKTNEEQ